MKKFFILLVVLLTAITFPACGTDNHEKSRKIKVVATIFPVYDWTRELIGGDEKNFDLKLLMDDGVDLHSFQPSAQDIMKISTCDVFIYVGGESDAWVADALKNVKNKDIIVVKLTDVLGDKLKHEEHVEGMEEHHEHHEHEDMPDEHIWLSLTNAQILCDAITDALIKVNFVPADTLKKNSAAYKEKLSALDKKYRDTLTDAQIKALLFGDRFPFRYLVDDYGLKYYAAFAGCSAESEASFQTIKFLADKVDELNLPCVMTIDGSDEKIAETIIANSMSKPQKILTLDSMQSTKLLNAAHGATYLSAMEKNLEVLREALEVDR